MKREIEQQKAQQAEAERAQAEEIEQLRRQVQEEAAKVQTLGMVTATRLMRSVGAITLQQRNPDSRARARKSRN